MNPRRLYGAIDHHNVQCPIVIEIDTMYFQCARALKRARLWDAEAQRDPADLPKAGQLVQSVMKEFDAAEYDGALQQRQAKTLY